MPLHGNGSAWIWALRLHGHEKTCKDTTLGNKYRGVKNHTRGGLPCQNWASQEPHNHTRTPERYPHSGLVDNFCRNPDNEPDGPWCYTTTDMRWDYCGVKYCRLKHLKITHAGLDENYCRNPDEKPYGPWCYTTSKEKRWEYCDGEGSVVQASWSIRKQSTSWTLF
ncbi:plasminogen-like [Rhopilema esculentum]|uniref:plasminogen-like n=1 Tax=Rhopilema esculentum TaxID=499914 RepID=UPI0031D3E8E1